MSNNSGATSLVGGIVVVGLVYWLAIGVATAIAFSLLGAFAVMVAAILFLVMAGVAFMDPSRRRDERPDPIPGAGVPGLTAPGLILQRHLRCVVGG